MPSLSMWQCLVPNELRYVDQSFLPLSGADMLVIGDNWTLANYWWSSVTMFMLGSSIFLTWVDPIWYICSVNITSLLAEKLYINIIRSCWHHVHAGASSPYTIERLHWLTFWSKESSALCSLLNVNLMLFDWWVERVAYRLKI